MPPDETLAHVANVAFVPVQQLAQRGRRRGRLRTRKQARQKLHPRGRQLDDRLVHQMQQHVLPPDVDDERHPRFQCRDVGEVLIGSDSQVDAAASRRPFQLRHDALERALVRDEVVGNERAAGLGQIGHQLPERAVTQASRELF